jgi:hypothetical protein
MTTQSELKHFLKKQSNWFVLVCYFSLFLVITNESNSQSYDYGQKKVFNWKAEAKRLDTADYARLKDSMRVNSELLLEAEQFECYVKEFVRQALIKDWHLIKGSFNCCERTARLGGTRSTHVFVGAGKNVDNPRQLLLLSNGKENHGANSRAISGTIGRELLYTLNNNPEILIRVTTYPYSDSKEYITGFRPKLVCTISLGPTFTLNICDYKNSTLDNLCDVGINKFMVATLKLYSKLQSKEFNAVSSHHDTNTIDGTSNSIITTNDSADSKKEERSTELVDGLTWPSKYPIIFLSRIVRLLLPTARMKSASFHVKREKRQPIPLYLYSDISIAGKLFVLSYRDEDWHSLKYFQKWLQPRTSDSSVLKEKWLDSGTLLRLLKYDQDSYSALPQGLIEIYIISGLKEISIEGEIEALREVAEYICKITNLSQRIMFARKSEESACE